MSFEVIGTRNRIMLVGSKEYLYLDRTQPIVGEQSNSWVSYAVLRQMCLEKHQKQP